MSLQDNALYLTAIGNTGIDIDGLPTAFEALNSTIEARPETEAAAKISSQEVEELNAEIDRLQADADVLRASISEVDTKGKQPDPANPAAQMSILEGVLQRNITDNRFDFRMRTNRLRETRERLAPTIAAVSEYESPEVLSGRNMQATVSSVPLTVEGDYILPETGLDPISSPPSEQPELALDHVLAYKTVCTCYENFHLCLLFFYLLIKISVIGGLRRLYLIIQSNKNFDILTWPISSGWL